MFIVLYTSICSFVALSQLKKMEKTAAVHVGQEQKQSQHHSYEIAENREQSYTRIP
jgi:hypothetical protein